MLARTIAGALVPGALGRAVRVRAQGGGLSRSAIARIAFEHCPAGIAVVDLAGVVHAATARLTHDAAHDALTGLPNRRALTVELADLTGDPGAGGVVDDAGARALGDHVLGAVIGPARLAGATVALRASVGTRRITAGEDDALALVRDADAALYRAKAAGGCCARLAHAGEGDQVAPASCDLPAA